MIFTVNNRSPEGTYKRFPQRFKRRCSLQDQRTCYARENLNLIHASVLAEAQMFNSRLNLGLLKPQHGIIRDLTKKMVIKATALSNLSIEPENDRF